MDTAFRMSYSQCISLANSSDERKPQRMQLREHEMERRPIFFTKLSLKHMSVQLKEYQAVVSSANVGP